MKSRQTINQRQRIYDELKKRILLGQYKPGFRLNEKEICKEFVISRTPYREALIRLEIDGLVVISPKVGVVISYIDLQSLKDVFEMRNIFEGVGAKFAFKRIQTNHLNALRDIVEKIESLSNEDDISSYLELDTQFHNIIYEAQGNQILRNVLEKLYIQCIRLWNTIENQDFIKDLIISSIRDVRKIYEAFSAKDPDTVERLIKEHFTAYLNTLKVHLFRGFEDEIIPRKK